jgi:DNA-binding MarR family transcriptional regulator
MMTRKDYVETANILKDSRAALYSLGEEGEAIFNNLVFDFAEMFKQDNDRFIEPKFYSACLEGHRDEV